MKVISGAANYHRRDWSEPAGRSTFEFSGKEVADLLLKQIDKPGAAVNKILVRCPDGKHIKVDELNVALVVDFY